MSDGKLSSEDQERLRGILGQLEEALEQAEARDETTRARLAALAEGVRGLLEEGPGATPQARLTFGSRLSEELAHLEGSHPDLAYAIGQVIEALSGLGL